jgi:hypothetical protein
LLIFCSEPRFAEPRMAPAPSFTLRVLRAALIAALLLIALGPTFAAAASPTPAAGNPSVAELEQLVQTLKDDKERQAFVTQLETLIASHRAVAAKPSKPEDLVSILSDRINALGDELLAGVAVLVDAPLLLAWTKGQIANEYTRALWGQDPRPLRLSRDRQSRRILGGSDPAGAHCGGQAVHRRPIPQPADQDRVRKAWDRDARPRTDRPRQAHNSAGYQRFRRSR